MFLVRNRATRKIYKVLSVDRELVKSGSTWDITEFLIYKT